MVHNRVCILALLACCECSSQIRAEEPNESFGQRTILGAGVLSVTDSVTPGGSGGESPDTIVAAYNNAGFEIGVNDNGGPWEGNLGSALYDLGVNNDSSIWFQITGWDDFEFQGAHDQSGDYRVYVKIVDQFQTIDEEFDFVGSLEPGEVDTYAFDGFNTNYTYNVEIDNTIGSFVAADIDFFTFTDLTPGWTFSADVTQDDYDGFNSILGWFDDNGQLLVTDNDSGFATLSQITGTVPVSGELTFAVTGWDDYDFQGLHGEDATYALELTLIPDELNGDFDNDGDVDGRDFLVWQRGDSPTSLSAADLAEWQEFYGTGSLAAVAAVPEPGALALLAIAMCGGLRRRLWR